MADLSLINHHSVAALAGGALIGAAAALLMWTTGKIAGISGIFAGILPRGQQDIGWRGLFIAGLLSGGLIVVLLKPDLIQSDIPRSISATIVAGLLVGFGSRLGNGCTSGHGVCGLSRMSPRSLASVLTFMSTGAATAFAVRVLFGGSL